MVSQVFKNHWSQCFHLFLVVHCFIMVVGWVFGMVKNFYISQLKWLHKTAKLTLLTKQDAGTSTSQDFYETFQNSRLLLKVVRIWLQKEPIVNSFKFCNIFQSSYFLAIKNIIPQTRDFTFPKHFNTLFAFFCHTMKLFSLSPWGFGKLMQTFAAFKRLSKISVSIKNWS